MISTNNQQLTDIIWKSASPIDLDDVEILLPGQPPVKLPFSASISGGKSGLHCIVRIPQGSVFPDEIKKVIESLNRSSNHFTLKDTFQIRGRATLGMMVLCDGVWPSHEANIKYPGPTSHLFSFQKINLPAEGMDDMDHAQIIALLKSLNPSKASSQDTTVETTYEESFFAIIRGVSLSIRNTSIEVKEEHPYYGKRRSSKQKCFVADLLSGIICLEDVSGDLHINFKRKLIKGETPTISREQIIESILQAVGFIHQCHPWPDYQEEAIDRKVVNRWIQNHGPVKSSMLAPFRSYEMTQSGDGAQLFLRAAEFFSTKSFVTIKQNKDMLCDQELYKRLLWFSRNACLAGITKEITLLSLCSVLEGLIKQAAGQRLGEKEDPWRNGVEKLGLDFDNWFKDIFIIFKAYRNDLAHGFDPQDPTKQQDILLAYAKITSAIYVIMGKQMGYKGKIPKSLFSENGSIGVITI